MRVQTQLYDYVENKLIKVSLFCI